MKKHILVFVIFLISFSIFLFFNPTYTGFAVYQPVQPELSLELTTTTYSSGDKLDGNLIITTKGRLKEDSLVKVEINGEETEAPLIYLLDSLGLYYDSDPGSTYVTNAETEKELSFNAAGSKEVAFKVQKRAVVDSIDLKITGNSVKFPTLDFFSDDINELIYLGDPSSGWPTEKIFSPDLDLSEKGTASVNLQKGVYYCELIDLPYAKDYKIAAKYGGDTAKGKVLYVKEEYGSYNAKSYSGDPGCTFSKSSDWSYCTVSFDKPVYGEHLVCIYSEKDSTYMEVEQKSPYSGYKCDIEYVESDEGDICRKVEAGISVGDFFIGAIKKEYEGILDSSILLSDYNPELIINQINTYLAICREDLCAIPIKVSSESSGIIKLSNLAVYYGDKFTDKLFDSEITFPTIYNINNQDLDDEDITISVPLDFFDITVPDVSENENLTLKITLGSESIEGEIEVYGKTEIPSLDEIISIFENYTLDQREIAKVYGIDADLVLINLQEFETKIKDIEESSLDEKIKQDQIKIITNELEDYLSSLPLSIKIQKSFKNIPLNPSKVKDDYLVESQRTQAIKDQIQILQSKISIKIDILGYKIIFEDVTEEKTLIKKTVSGDLTNIYLIEEIPKVEANSVNDIRFGTDNYEIIEEDPVVRWYVDSLPFTITYALPGEFVSEIKDFSTLIFPKEISFEPSEKYKKVRCGDGKCTVPLEDKITCPEDCAKKINWTFVIILLLILIAGIYYLNFYRGRYSFKKLQVPKRVFKSRTDEINLINYIKKSVNLRVPKDKIKKVLLAKGWSERQIDHVFDKLYKY